MLSDTDSWDAIEDVLNFCVARMKLTPYYSEPSNFVAKSGG